MDKNKILHTGNTLMPANLSITGAITGFDNKGPMIGKDLKNWTIIPKKSPNSPIIPRDSTRKPIKVHFIRIINIPRLKKKEPRLFVGLEKNITVF